MPEALVVDIQLAAPPPGSRERLVDCPPPPGSRAAKLARLKELPAKYAHQQRCCRPRTPRQCAAPSPQ